MAGLGGTFRALRARNYRVWAVGALVSNVGTWMQRTAQDWLVLTVLTHHSAADVGIVTALQFGPQLLFLPWTGSAADRFDRRRLLMLTQSLMGTLALALGVLTVTGLVRLWEVYGFAFLLGTAASFDAPARQTFVGELVGEAELSNAVGLNSASFSAARLIGPACAGLLIDAVGSGWVFVANAATYVAVLGSLAALRVRDLHRLQSTRGGGRGLADGARYVWGRADLKVVLAMLFLVATFGINFQIFISTMSVSVFHVGAGTFGGVMSVMSVGSLSGALLAARRERPSIGLLAGASALFAVGLGLAAAMTDFRLFALFLVVVGGVGADGDDVGDEPGADGNRSIDAGAGDRDPAGGVAGRNAAGSADDRVGGGSVRAALGNGGWGRSPAWPRPWWGPGSCCGGRRMERRAALP